MAEQRTATNTKIHDNRCCLYTVLFPQTEWCDTLQGKVRFAIAGSYALRCNCSHVVKMFMSISTPSVNAAGPGCRIILDLIS